jgi:hypothetical protein
MRMHEHEKFKEYAMIMSVRMIIKYVKVLTTVPASDKTTFMMTVAVTIIVVKIGVIGMTIELVGDHENEMTTMATVTVLVLVFVEADEVVATEIAEIVNKIASVAETKTNIIHVTKTGIIDMFEKTVKNDIALREAENVVTNVIVIDLIVVRKNKVVIILRNVVEVKTVLVKSVLAVEKGTLKMTRMERIQIRQKVQMVTILIETQDEITMIEMVTQVVTVINLLDEKMKLTEVEEMVVKVNEEAKAALIEVQKKIHLVMIKSIMKELLIRPMTITFLLSMIMNLLTTTTFLTSHRL